jgi:hypothetical protein
VKSKYFESDLEDDHNSIEGSTFESVEEESSAAQSDEEDSEQAAPARVRVRSTKETSSKHKKDSDVIDRNEYLKPGAELPEGTRLMIERPKARSAGKTPYKNETIHPNTLLFLQELAANNERNWLKSKIRLFN